MGSVAYTRVLHPSDYGFLQPHVQRLEVFKEMLRSRSVPFREDHQHRVWEYAVLLDALEKLAGPGARVLDAGSGNSYLPLYLSMNGYTVHVNDSGVYGDVLYYHGEQCRALALDLPLHVEPVESMTSIEDDSFDVTSCVSVIEHVDPPAYERAWRELWRVTKPGGLIYVTSDYFRDLSQADQSKYRSIQHNILTAERVRAVPKIIQVTPVGPMELEYRGDWVHNYSFVSMLWRKESRTRRSRLFHGIWPFIP